jgi:hypothetical protein
MESALAEGELSALLMKPYRPDEILEKISLAVLRTGKALDASDRGQCACTLKKAAD